MKLFNDFNDFNEVLEKKSFNDFIGNRTRIVPQPTALPRAPV
jgi:hypothetical protein